MVFVREDIPSKMLPSEASSIEVIKLAANNLISSLSQSVNSSIKKGLFPENEKIALVTPVDKKTNDKNSVLNFHPKIFSNCFSKVYKKMLKTQLMEKMNNLSSL